MSQSRTNDMQINPNEIDATVTPHGEQFVAQLGNPSFDEIIAGSSDSAANILDRLNDDCIIQVFEYLPLGDLCNVADVCRAFESNALSVFKRRHTVLALDELLVSSDDEEWESGSDDEESQSDSDYSVENSDSDIEWHNEYNMGNIPAETVRNLFLHFGTYMKAVDLTVEYEYEDQIDGLLELMATFCTHKDAQLRKLTMNDVTIASDLIPRIQPLFDRLTILDITGGSIYSFCIGAELTELTLENIYLDEIFTQKFGKLQTLSLVDVLARNQGSLYLVFESFLEMASQVKRLSIKGRMRPNLWSLRRLPPELEEFELDVIGEYEDIKYQMKYLVQLRNLTVLTLDCMDRSTTQLFNHLVEQNVPIEELNLRNFTLTENAATSLSVLSTIKKLTFADGGWTENVRLSNVIKELPVLEKLHFTEFGCVTIGVIKSAIECAPQLKELVVHFNHGMIIEIGSHAYNEIGRLIQKRLDMSKLSMELRGTDIKMNVPDRVVERLRLWLEVTVVTFKNVRPVDIIDYYGFSDDSESEAGDSDD